MSSGVLGTFRAGLSFTECSTFSLTAVLPALHPDTRVRGSGRGTREGEAIFPRTHTSPPEAFSHKVVSYSPTAHSAMLRCAPAGAPRGVGPYRTLPRIALRKSATGVRAERFEVPVPARCSGGVTSHSPTTRIARGDPATRPVPFSSCVGVAVSGMSNHCAKGLEYHTVSSSPGCTSRSAR